MDDGEQAEPEQGAEGGRPGGDERPVPDLTSPAATRNQVADAAGYDSSDNTGSSSIS
jgi:hypothetical protein